MKRIKIFDNQDDLYKKSNTEIKYEEEENKVIDCGHLIESDHQSSASSSSSDSSEERYYT